MKGSAALFLLAGGGALVQPTACTVSYRPDITNAIVSCTTKTAESQGLWRFSGWVEDDNGADDVVEVKVDILDFASEFVTGVTLEHTEDTHWQLTVDDEELPIECVDFNEYLYVFRAIDSEEEEDSFNFYP